MYWLFCISAPVGTHGLALALEAFAKIIILDKFPTIRVMPQYCGQAHFDFHIQNLFHNFVFAAKTLRPEYYDVVNNKRSRWL